MRKWRGNAKRAASWIARSPLTASGRRSKVSYVASGSEDIDL